jgi:hypothetical protein
MQGPPGQGDLRCDDRFQIGDNSRNSRLFAQLNYQRTRFYANKRKSPKSFGSFLPYHRHQREKLIIFFLVVNFAF